MEKSIKGPLTKILVFPGVENKFMPRDIYNFGWHANHDTAGSLTGMKKISQAGEHQRDLVLREVWVFRLNLMFNKRGKHIGFNKIVLFLIGRISCGWRGIPKPVDYTDADDTDKTDNDKHFHDEFKLF